MSTKNNTTAGFVLSFLFGCAITGGTIALYHSDRKKKVPSLASNGSKEEDGVEDKNVSFIESCSVDEERRSTNLSSRQQEANFSVSSRDSITLDENKFSSYGDAQYGRQSVRGGYSVSDIPTIKTTTHIQDDVQNGKNIMKDDSNWWIRLVIQRARSASLNINADCDASARDVDTKEHSRTGLVVYVSFAKGNDDEAKRRASILSAAKTLLNLPLVTTGHWGDGSKSKSTLSMSSELDEDSGTSHRKQGVFMMIIPQASLICKPKGPGKSMQYHGQIDKNIGKGVYEDFISALNLLCIEHQYKTRGVALPNDISDQLNSYTLQSPDAQTPVSCPPEKMFKDDALYSSWDDAGFPLTTKTGESVSKSALKRLRKRFDKQKKRYMKFVNQVKVEDNDAKKIEEGKASVLDPSFIFLISGTFGALQALSISSDMGPFCHVIHQ